MIRRNIRYIFWLISGFLKKYQKILFITFLLTFFIITLFFSSLKYILTKKEKIGIVGRYSISEPPTELLSLISNPLLYINQKGEYQPVLVSSWEAIDNYKKFRITLKDNLYWNDGKKINTDDINLKLKGIKMEKLDERNIIFILEKPSPIFLNYLTKPLLKEGLVGAAGIYSVSKIKLKNGYLSEIYLQPKISNLPSLVYLFFENEEKMMHAYKKGEINKMIIKKKAVAENFSKWRNTKITKLIDYSHPVTIFFNLKDKRLSDRELRTAISKAVNKAVFKELGEIAYGPIPSNSIYFDKKIATDIYSPELARNYIQTQYQSSNSASLKLTMITSYDFFDIVEILKKQLAEANINLEIQIINRIPSGDFSLLLSYWTVPNLDDQYFFWHSSQSESNLSHYQNLKVDKILEEIRATTKVSVKKKLAADFQKNFADDPPAIFLYYPFLYQIERK